MGKILTLVAMLAAAAVLVAPFDTYAKGSRSSGGSHARSGGSHHAGARSHSSTRSTTPRASTRSPATRSPSHATTTPRASTRSTATRSSAHATSSAGSHSSTKAQGVARDSHGRIARSSKATHAFQKTHPCPSTGKSSGACPGYVIDHIKPLKRGGADSTSNMQWQTKQAAKEKDKTE